MSEPAACLVVAGSAEQAVRLLGTVEPGAPVTLVLPELETAALESDDDDGALLRLADRVVGVRGWTERTEPEALGRGVVALADGHAAVVLGSAQRDRDLAGWLAVSLDAPVAWGVERVTPGPASVQVVRAVHGGARRVTQLLEGVPAVVLARPTGVPLAGPRPAPAAERRIELDGMRRLEIVAAAAPRPSGTSLTGARIVVAVGRGIGGPDQVPVFQRLADRLGAALGASRAVVDAGWLPFAHQVGQTGATVTPDLYLAFGISGAIQHLAGMRGAHGVVAVNTDPDAPLCGLADLVVEGDAVDQARRLLDLLEN